MRLKAGRQQSRRGARRRDSRGWSPRAAVGDWLARHAQVLVASLGRLYRTPVGTLMTAMVLGIALALPGGLLVVVDNLQRLAEGWHGQNHSISVFLKADTPLDAARRLAARLRERPDVATVELITPEQAMAEFRRLSGFGDILDALDENPLPAVLVVQPQGSGRPPVNGLVDELGRLPEVDLVQLDLQWVERFEALVAIARRGILVLGALLALSVLLVVGNTIRLDIQNRREEIEVSKLIGATDAFIRRPFLYSGLWFGLLGALIARLLIEISVRQLAGPVRELAGLYQSQFRLHTLGLGDSLILLAAGAALGLAGSWLAVGRHLRQVEPN